MAEERLIARVGADVTNFKSGMASVTKIASTTMKRVALATTGFMTTAAIIGSKFQYQLMETATVAQAYGQDLKDLENKARELGRTTAFTATEAARGMYDLASAGLNAKQVIDATQHSMLLAGATGSEMAQATRLVASTLSQFGLEANQTKRIADVYAQAITKSQLTMERLTEAMKYAGTIGAAFGWSLEQTTASVAQFANLGLEGSQAGTNFRMAMLALTKPTEAATAALGRMNLTMDDIDPETKDFGEILKILGDRFLTTADAAEIFGTRAGANMKQLAYLARTGQLDFEGFVKSLDEAQNGIGRSAEMYNRMMNTFKGQWDILKSAFQDLMITVFDQFDSQGRDVFRALKERIDNLGGWIQNNSVKIKGFFTAIKDSIIGIADQMDSWIRGNNELLNQKLPALLIGIGDALKGIVKLFSSLPNEVIGAAGTGIIVRMLTGSTPIAMYASALKLIYDIIKDFEQLSPQQTLESIQKHIDSGGFVKLFKEQIRLLEREIERTKNGETLQVKWLNQLYQNDPFEAQAQVDAIIENLESQIQIFRNKLAKLSPITIMPEVVVKGKSLTEYTKEELEPFDEVWSGLSDSFSESLITELSKKTFKDLNKMSKGLEDFYSVSDEIFKESVDNQWQIYTSNAEKISQLGANKFATQMDTLQRELVEFGKMGASEIALEQYKNDRMKEMLIERNDYTLEHTQSLLEGLRAAWENYVLQTKPIISQLSELAMNTIQTFTRGIGDAFANTIVYGENLATQFRSLFQNVAAQIISTLVQIGVERMIQWVLAKTLGMAETATVISSLAAQTYAGAFASTAMIPVIGPALAPSVAAASLAAMLAGTAAAKGVGLGVGAVASYDQGGISTTPGYYYSGVREAHIPLKGNNKIPVDISGQENTGTTIIMNNPTFQDQATQRATFAMIAEQIAKQVAPLAVQQNYNNDGSMRSLIRNPV